ncbi:MAG: RimK/LysX family protein [Desulfobacteraceae bacterium]|jgi:hypothetical protein
MLRSPLEKCFRGLIFRRLSWPLLGVVALSLFVLRPALGDGKAVIGWIERVSIYPGSLVLHAKVDTAADHSSLHVTDIQPVSRNGHRWVRFKALNRQGEAILFECRVLKTARIKRKGLGPQKRYVVNMGICLGKVFKEVPVNLEDRTGFKFHMLVGRSFLKDSFVVDPSLKYTREPACKIE